MEAIHTTPVVAEADTETSIATSRASSTTPEITEKPTGKAPEASPEKASETTSKTATSSAEDADENRDRVTAIGDSVMVGAAGELERSIGNLAGIDAEIGLQATAATEILRERRDADQIGEVVVVHVGTNGTFNDEQFDALMRVLADAHKVVVVNVKAPRLWEQPNNAMLAEGVRRYPNSTLVDWYAASAARPELFWEDGIHLRPEGAQLYADLISASIDDGSG